jgi:hypothetical protein
MNILVHQTEHLRLLKRAHAARRRGHKHPHALFAAHCIFSRTASVARRSAKNVQLLAFARQLVFKQITQQLHRHIFESQRGAVGQRLQADSSVQLFKWHDFFSAIHCFGIGLLAQRLQIRRRNVVDIQRQNLKRQGSITLRSQRCPTADRIQANTSHHPAQGPLAEFRKTVCGQSYSLIRRG